MKILYKTDTKGKQRYLKIYTTGCTLIQESGIVDTDSPIIHKKTCKGKNIGKSNETSPSQQAVSEMASKVTDKLTEGYFETLSEAKTQEVILPMLAKDYNKESKKINWEGNVHIQPKLDGMRCLAFIKDGVVTFKSRDGKIINGLQHIKDELEAKIKTDCTLDGELYCHGQSFQENMKLIKKYRPGKTEEVKYHVYDTVSNGIFRDRFAFVRSLDFDLYKHVRNVETHAIKTEEKLKRYHNVFISEGYEGSIIRHGDAEYKVAGRSSNLLKYKDFQDIIATIVDIEPAEARPEWGIPVLKYSNQKLTGVNEYEFRAGTKMSHDDRKDLLKNKHQYIGKTAEIRFFEYSDDGIPRFPVMVGIRLDK